MQKDFEKKEMESAIAKNDDKTESKIVMPPMICGALNMFSAEKYQKFFQDFGWLIMAFIIFLCIIITWFRNTRCSKEGRSTSISSTRVFKAL